MTLHLDQVSHSYSGLCALQPLTMTIADGERHAIIGPNGAGKTTLLNLVAGTLKPSTGRIRLHHMDITRLTPDRRATAGIARTHQHPAIWPQLTVTEHLLLASSPGRGVRDRVATATRYPHTLLAVGLQDRADTRAGTLSYGERRLLELAVALAGNPRLLLLDEPSAGLSRPDLDRLRKVISELSRDVTFVLVDHHLDLVFDVADTVTVLHHGKHLTTGSPDDVRSDPEVRAAYLATTGHTATVRPVRTVATGPPVLTCEIPALGYGNAPVLTNIDLALRPGQAMALVGANGVGKSTTLNALAGLHRGMHGTVTVAGRSTAGRPPSHAVEAGLALVPQGRRLWPNLTVAEHLLVARPAHRSQTMTSSQLLELFPALADRLHHPGKHLSGGEQQMLAIARALATSPQVLLMDEPSEGLAPAVTSELATTLNTLIDRHGLAVLFTEPTLALALDVADLVSVLHDNTIAADYLISDIRDNPEIVTTMLTPASR